jgi:hypothetical protein
VTKQSAPVVARQPLDRCAPLPMISGCGGAIARRPFVISSATIATLKDDGHEH